MTVPNFRVKEKGKFVSKRKKTFANVIRENDRYTRILHIIFDFRTNSEKKRTFQKKNIKKKIQQKTASSPEQDLHPDWDRFRGTMLYPLSCGELAINGE